MNLQVKDICHGDRVATRAIVMQQKTSLPVQFEITPPSRDAVDAWIKASSLKSEDYLFPQPNSCFAASWYQAVRSQLMAGSRKSAWIQPSMERIPCDGPRPP